jgi:hypothetical protein
MFDENNKLKYYVVPPPVGSIQYKMLEAIRRHPGITGEQIANMIYGECHDASEMALVSVTISFLRKRGYRIPKASRFHRGYRILAGGEK